MMADILVEIPDSDLPKLILLFNKHTKAIFAKSLVTTGIHWKKNKKYKNCYKFYSVGNTWLTDGSIVVLQTNFCYNIFVYTLNNDSRNLEEALKTTKLLDYKNPKALFFGIQQEHVSLIQRVLEEKKLKSGYSEYWMYILEVSSIDELSFSLPTEIYYRELTADNAEQINSRWDYKFDDSVNFIKSLIEVNGGYGIFLKGSNEMVSWILKYNLSYIGMLQTEDNWKRQGFGKLVTKIVTKQILQSAIPVIATIDACNTPSVNLFENLNFEKIGKCAFLKL